MHVIANSFYSVTKDFHDRDLKSVFSLVHFDIWFGQERTEKPKTSSMFRWLLASEDPEAEAGSWMGFDYVHLWSIWMTSNEDKDATDTYTYGTAGDQHGKDDYWNSLFSSNDEPPSSGSGLPIHML